MRFTRALATNKKKDDSCDFSSQATGRTAEVPYLSFPVPLASGDLEKMMLGSEP